VWQHITTVKITFQKLLAKIGLNSRDAKRTLLISLPIWAIIILPGLVLSLHDWWTTRAQLPTPMTVADESVPSAPIQPEVPSTPPMPAAPVAEVTPTATPTPTPAPESAPPAPKPVVVATPTPTPVAVPPAPAPVAAPSVPAPVAPSVPTIVYQDTFGRQGELKGSSPDAKNTNGAKWSVSSGPGTYVTKGTAVSDNHSAYDAAFLPVNGTSGVTLNGKENFTLSATVTPEQAGYWMGISLNTAPVTNGHNMADNGMAEMTIGKGYADAYDHGANLYHDETAYAAGTPYVISMTYHAAKGSLTYSVGNRVIATLDGVKPEQIAALADVAMGNGNSGPTGTISNFSLTVGGLD
jgi:hypothetical protein